MNTLISIIHIARIDELRGIGRFNLRFSTVDRADRGRSVAETLRKDLNLYDDTI